MIVSLKLLTTDIEYVRMFATDKMNVGNRLDGIMEYEYSQLKIANELIDRLKQLSEEDKARLLEKIKFISKGGIQMNKIAKQLKLMLPDASEEKINNLRIMADKIAGVMLLQKLSHKEAMGVLHCIRMHLNNAVLRDNIDLLHYQGAFGCDTNGNITVPNLEALFSNESHKEYTG